MLLRYPHLEQRSGDLPQRAVTHYVHQHLEHVPAADQRLLQTRTHRPGLVLVPGLEVAQAL